MTGWPWPTLHDDSWRVLIGITSVLLLASLVGRVLKITLARGEAHAVIDNLNSRINAWWVIAIVLGLALLAGRAAITLLFALASLAALREFVPAQASGKIPGPLVLLSFVIVLPLHYLLVWNGSHALFTGFIPLYALVVVPMLGVLSGNRRAFLSGARPLQAGLLICVFCVSHLPALLTLQVSGFEKSNACLLIFLLLVVQSSDVLQYLWGKLAGRHLIAPKLSPAKTIEGTAGGILSASALGAGLSSLTPFTQSEAALISLLLTLLGFLGGLAMSAVKRRRGIKDWSRLIPGHGGMLDRLDSLFLPAPVFYYLLRYGWPA